MPTPTPISLPANSPRIETGPIQFGEDWPGLFIRGDDAIMLAASIRQLEKCRLAVEDPEARSALVRLVEVAEVIERDVVEGRAARNGKK